MQSVRKPRWQRATALMSLSTCGAMTGFAFAHGTVAELTSPTSVPVHLLALAKPTQSEPTNDSALRSAIVKAATYYLRLARDQSPAEMQALIWQGDSVGGADHGESCAAFASLVLEMGARATGQQSWVSGGATYPWPLHDWADVRVEPNPDSPGVVSIQQDAEAHDRWHPLGDGYTPQPGDWVLFEGHVEVVVKYTGGVLYTVGGDSMPNLSVNAHQYGGPLAAQGVVGFVNNGELVTTTSQSGPVIDEDQADLGQTAIPGLMADVLSPASASQQAPPAQQQPAGAHASALGSAAIPGLLEPTGIVGANPQAEPGPAYGRNQPSSAQVSDTAAQQAFINEIAPGAMAAQHRYGIPAAVTIAQAIDESGWGQSQLATVDHNLFGIKGTGPAGTVVRPTEEYQDGSWVATTASFRVYHNVAESIADHSRLLATGESYQQAMADRHVPDAFANDLTGVYATDPNYGANLIALMRLYNLYRYDPSPSAPTTPTTAPPHPAMTLVAAVDHGADLPGLEPVDVALGGPAGLGAAPAGSGHSVPRPRGAAQAGPIGAARAAGGQTLGTAQSGRTPAGTAQGRAARGAPGWTGTAAGGQGPGGTTPTRQRPGGTAPSRQGPGAATPSRLAPGATTPSRLAPGAATPSRQAAGTSTRPSWPGSGTTTPGGLGRSGLGRSGLGRSGLGRGGSARGGTVLGGARIPGLADEYPGTLVASASARTTARLSPRGRAERYEAQIPSVVTTDFVTMAKHPLARSRPLYQDVARGNRIRWELLAACDWMQCKAQPQHSPVRGERLGTKNPDGTRFRTKSEALEQCAADLIVLADAVYQIDLTAPMFLSVLELAQVFAAFRWGGLLRAHRVSAMEFPYSVEGLTVQHLDLRWPDISEPNAPDRPGTRFRMPFGAVPAVLSLGYPAVA